MAIEKCINEFDAGDVIFEEGSTGRELFVVLEGQVEIQDQWCRQDRPRHARQRRIFWRDGGDRRIVAFRDRHRRGGTYPRDADQPRPLRLSGQSAAGFRAHGDGRTQQAAAGIQCHSLQRGNAMSERRPSPFPVLRDNDVCSLIQAAEDVYQVRFKNRAANAYVVRGSSRTIMIDVGLSSNYPHLLQCLDHVGCPPEKIDIVVLNHEHLDHIGAAYHFNGTRTIMAAHRLAANKIMLRDDFSMLRKMFNEPNVPIDIDLWLEEGNLIDLGNFRLDVMYTPGHTSACISLFDQEKGLLFAADTLMPGGVMGGVFGS